MPSGLSSPFSSSVSRHSGPATPSARHRALPVLSRRRVAHRCAQRRRPRCRRAQTSSSLIVVSGSGCLTRGKIHRARCVRMSPFRSMGPSHRSARRCCASSPCRVDDEHGAASRAIAAAPSDRSRSWHVPAASVGGMQRRLKRSAFSSVNRPVLANGLPLYAVDAAIVAAPAFAVVARRGRRGLGVRRSRHRRRSGGRHERRSTSRSAKNARDDAHEVGFPLEHPSGRRALFWS